MILLTLSLFLMPQTAVASAMPPSLGPRITQTVLRSYRPGGLPACTEVEPAGNVTLVGLDTFYRVEWSAEGFQPGEVNAIDPARMLGYQVYVRPRLVGLTYRFGDGSEFGPTPSLGGRYADGPIRHQYPTTGTYPVSVAVTWGGDFRIDGGEWTPIPNTVVVEGPATPLEVKAARAVLVQR